MSVADGSALLSARLREAWACVELDGLDRCVVVMRGSWSLRGGSVAVVIGVCGCGVRACCSSGGVRVVGPVCSSHDCWPVAVLSSRLVVTGPLLLCRCSTVGLLGSGSLVHRSSCHWSVTALLLLCLIAHRCSAACLSPVRRSSAVRSLLVRLLLCRCSVCLAVAFLSLVCHWSVCSGRGHWFVARPWLARLFVLLLARPWLVCCWFLCSSHGHWCRHYFVCSYAADPWFVTRPSVRVRVAGPSARLSAWVMAAGPSLIRLFVHHCSVCSGRGRWSVCSSRGRWSVCSGRGRWSVCSSHGRWSFTTPSAHTLLIRGSSVTRPSVRIRVARPSARPSLLCRCSAVRLSLVHC